MDFPLVEDIGNESFYACTSLSIAVFPRVKSVGVNTFWSCTALRSLLLPPSPPSVGLGGFLGCPIPRSLVPVDAAGALLTGNEWSLALAAYRAEEDGNTEDALWYGWTLPSMGVHTITVAPSSNGTVLLPRYAPAGTTVQLFVRPDLGFGLQRAECAMQGGGEVPIAGGAFVMPDGDVTVSATFAPNALKVTVNGRSLPPAGNLAEALREQVLSEISTLEVTGGYFHAADWAWLRANRGNLQHLTHFAITGAAAGVADIPSTEESYFGPNLQSLRMAGVTSIGSGAFRSCSALATVHIPSVQSIGSMAFHGCVLLPSVDFQWVTCIGNGAFDGCSSLATVAFPRVESIGQRAFYGCKSLSTIASPKVVDIGDGAFEECERLTAVDFPQLTIVRESLFRSCTALATISLPRVAHVGQFSFYNCRALVKVDLPQVASIEAWAFNSCTALNTVSLPQVKGFGEGVFAGCTALRSLLLPVEPPVIQYNSFRDVPRGEGDPDRNDPALYCYLYVPTDAAKTAYEAHGDWRAFMPNIRVVVPPTSFEVVPEKLTLTVGEARQLRAENFQPAQPGVDIRVVWSSDNAGVVDVDATGKIAAVAEGTVTITATSVAVVNVKAMCEVTVQPKPQSVLLSGCKGSVPVGETFTLTASVLPAGASQAVSWSSSDAAVATVDANGQVMGVAVGTATITVVSVADDNLRVDCIVEVKPARPTGVVLSGCKASIVVGETFPLTASVQPAAALQGVTWSSDNDAVATVDGDGRVRGVAEGMATITAASVADGNVKSVCSVEVREAAAPTGVVLSGCKASVAEGDSFTLTAEVLPAGALQAVNWSSDNAGVATVDGSGKVVAVAAGTAIIAAVSQADGTKRAECVVAVRSVPQSVSLSGCVASIAVGEAFALTASVQPAGAVQDVVWSSDNSAVATVDVSGRVMGVAEGEATISAASAVNGGLKAGCRVAVRRKDNGGSTPGGEATPIDGEVHPLMLTLVPNPASTSFRIEGLTEATTARIADAMGVVLGVYSCGPESEAIDIAHLPTGVYMVLVNGITLRLVVMR